MIKNDIYILKDLDDISFKRTYLYKEFCFIYEHGRIIS